MLIHNTMPSHDQALADIDRVMLGKSGADSVGRFLARREGYAATPLVSLPATAGQLGVASIHIKDESLRLGLGSFKALGGAYAVVCLAVEAASKEAGREIDVADWQNRDVRDVASRMTVACATDGNHGRSVAQGAQLVGAQCVIFVHAGVTQERADAIAAFGARIVRVDGNYDDSVEEASRVADAFMTIEEDEALTVMRQLARPTNGDPVIVAGESGGVGLAALAQVASERDMRSAIGLDASSRVFLINTEGATDPALYERLIGATPEAILAGEAAND